MRVRLTRKPVFSGDSSKGSPDEKDSNERITTRSSSENWKGGAECAIVCGLGRVNGKKTGSSKQIALVREG